ncbi:MAG TPA: TonB-dependent receptor [Acidocella sp.]|jgi:iron complex outermembrane receptor protein|nr:TonB-dependent receptor [Acidocella sp.]
MRGFWDVRLRAALRGFSSARCITIGLGSALAVAPAALAQTANAPVNLDLGSVLSTGSGGNSPANLINTPGTAPYESPSTAPLHASQPTSVVSKHTIDNMLIGTQSWADIARLTPSVNVINPNGPGLMEATGPTVRGFQNGQYNVTYDGIPIGDSNDFTQHSTSFFTNSEIGEMVIDRGPGDASTVGDATFGGTMSIRTVNPAPTTTATLNSSYGSYNTSDNGIRLDSGAIQAANGTTALFNVEHIQSDGALQNANQERTNFFGKVVIPVNNSTTITLLALYNQLYQNPPLGATDAQMSAFGWNYAYSSDPNSQAFYRLNYDRITTDMEYADIQSNLGDGFLYDGKIYTYAYYHHDVNGDDPNASGAIPNEVVLTPGGPAIPGIPGQLFKNDYRSVGTIQRLQKNFDWGDIKTGFWFDHQVNTRFVQNVALSNGNAINYDPNDSNGCQGTVGNNCTEQLPGFNNGLGSIERLQHNQLYTFQPYGQVDWQPIDGLTVTAGLKWAYFRRALDATVQQKTELITGYTHNWQKVLPSFDVTYAFTPNVSAYFQAAEGFLAPNLNTFYTQAISAQSLRPESTINFQSGVTYHDEHWMLSGDLYTIHFENFINHKNESINVNGSTIKAPVFFNSGGVIYRGVEAEAAYSFGNGVTLFGNAGYNEAFQTSVGTHIVGAPQGTANFGAIYNANGYYASIIDQWTGGQYSGNTGNGNEANSPAVGDSPGGWYDPYNVVNVALGYTFNHDNPAKTPISVKVNLDNITNQKKIIFDNGTDGNNNLLYFRLTGFSAFGSVSIPIGFGTAL